MKWRYLILAVFAVGFVSSTTQAEEGLELGGNVTTFFGWQKNDSNALGTLIGAIPERGVGTANRDTFNFYLDEVELNLQKSWGDKVRIRADLDFGSAALGSNFSDFAAATAFVLEQGYIGFNILDAEIIVGRFNVPIGVYSVDRINNVTISYPTVFGLLPSNGTGVKLFWGINDSWDVYGSYGYIHDWEGNLSAAGAGGFYTGADQQVHSGTVGVGYNIADGAKFRLEYRLDYQLPSGAASNAFTHAAVGSFSYAF